MGLTTLRGNATLCGPIPPPPSFSPSGANSMRRYALSAVLLVGWLPALAAQGFGIYEQGTCAMGRAGTGVAAPCPDGSLLAVPQAYLSYAVTPKLGVGVGLFAPYGLETRWPLAFDGRFAGYKNILRSVYLQPTVAYQVTPWLALGGGFDVVFGKVELNQRLDLADAPVPTSLGVPAGTVFGQFGIAPGTDFADAHLEATKTTVAGHFGAIAKVTDRLSVGARYLLRAKFDYAGTARFTQVPTGLVIPADITVGSFTIPAGTPVDALLAAPATSG